MSRFRPMEGSLLHVVAAVLTVFPWRAPASLGSGWVLSCTHVRQLLNYLFGISPHPLPRITGFPVTRLKFGVAYQTCQVPAEKIPHGWEDRFWYPMSHSEFSIHRQAITSERPKKLFHLVFELPGFHINFPFIALIADRHSDISPDP